MTDISGDEISNLTIDDEFTRTMKQTNDMGFDLATLQKRKNDMKELERLYPKMTPAWLEMAWNFCEITPKEEQDRIIKEGLWEGKPKKVRDMGGILKNAMTIEQGETP